MNAHTLVEAVAPRAADSPKPGVSGPSLRSVALGTALALCLAAPLGAATLKFFHPYGEIVDRRAIGAYVAPGSGDPTYSCLDQISIARDGTKFTVHARKAWRIEPGARCPSNARSSFALGPLAAGSYEITMKLWSFDGATIETFVEPLQVLPLDGRCNGDPMVSPSISGYRFNDGTTAAEFVGKVSSDPEFAAAIGNPVVELYRDVGEFGQEDLVAFTYPPLHGIPLALDRLAREAPWVDAFPHSRGNQCFTPPARDVVAAIVEYFHANLDRYFYTGDAGEVAAIDAGTVGPGWVRTGKSFNAVTKPQCLFTHGQSLVYRFSGVPGRGPDSHFFTRDRAECFVVDKSAKWSLEGLPFWASAPNADGSCDPLPGVGPRTPLHRAWRPVGDSNHRFSTDRAVIDEMVAKGWIDEGPAMCVLGSN